jgi:arylsulfatase A-like enzyme
MSETFKKGVNSRRPNVLLILNDDMGYSDIECYGGEMRTPNLNRLAARGLRYTQFYSSARCCPSRASLLTGLHPHQADVGDMVGDDQLDGYLGNLSKNSATIAEVLHRNGYRTYMSGKWHVTGDYEDSKNHNWPCQRGFDEYYGMLCGAGSYFWPKHLKRNNCPIETVAEDYYITDAISDEAVNQIAGHFAAHGDRPFFQFLAYTAPHWPLHARDEDVAACKGRFDSGWDALRSERLRRMVDMGILPPHAELSPRDPSQPAWEDTANKEWQASRMEVYAAQIESMDSGIGRVLDELEKQGQLDNTLIFFLADNGGCHEEIHHKSDWAQRLPFSDSAQSHTKDGREVRFGNIPEIQPGPEEGYCSYGVPWANLSNTPFRKYKHWVHEGGIATPLIVHWPEGFAARGEIRHQPGQLPDIMATILEATQSTYPDSIGDRTILRHEGYSLVQTFSDEPHGRKVLTWEHEGNCAIRRGKWKLVRECSPKPWGGSGYQEWELYDIEADRSELHDLATDMPELVQELEQEWQVWAQRCNVRDFHTVLEQRKKLREERY